MSRPIFANPIPIPRSSGCAPTNNQRTPLPTWAVHHNTVQSPYQDDCEEYVPLSQDVTPLENVSFVGMMSDAIDATPPPFSKSHSSPNEESPPSQVPIVEEVIESSKASKGTKGPRASAVVWEDASTHTLLRIYEEVWHRIKRGNLRTTDWEDITFGLNKEAGGSFNSQQVRNRINTLKKTYKDEMKRKNSTGSTHSTWVHFSICHDMWRKTPKITGLPGALDSDERRGCHVGTKSEPLHNNVDDFVCLEDDQVSQNPASKVGTIDLEGVVGKKVKQSKRSSIGAIARSMDSSTERMCAMMEKVEEKCNATLKEIELSRMALEERLAQMQVNMQLEMARILARRDH